MIITNSTPDKYYFNQLIAFLMSIKINSPTHLNLMRVFLVNYPKDLKLKLEKAFPDIKFENNRLKMMDSRGFSLIIDRAARVGECLQKYNEPVTWMDTDILVRGNISEILEVGPKELKILHRKGSPERVRINAGVFTIGNSEACKKFISYWHKRISRGKKWGDGQLEFWRGFKSFRKKIRMVELPLKYNSTGKFNEEYVVWHCKKGKFSRVKYQVEYKKYLSLAENHMGITS